MNSFAELDLIEPLRRAIADVGYERPTPIQQRAIPPLLAGHDVLGCAQTGTGKTAAFTLPVLQHLARHPQERGRRVIRALVLTPTRELAAQIGESFGAYGAHLHAQHLVIFGGVNQNPQVRALRKGVDVLIATPGRLLDLIGQGEVDLSGVDFFVLDEADRMLDMGFIHDVKRVLKLLPAKKQNLLFSATMPDAIAQLAGSFLRDPVRIEVTPQSTTVERIDQQIMFVEKTKKKDLLADLIGELGVERAIVFTRTKHGANRLVQQLERAGINAAAIHGNKSQSARERALAGFKDGDIPILVATDIASRGIDIDDVTHVFNYDLPNEPESYVHRIGRTGRAGRDGMAISFCDDSEGEYLRDIEKLTGRPLDVVEGHRYHFAAAMPSAGRRGAGPRPQPSEQSGQRGQRGHEHRGQHNRGQQQRGPHERGPNEHGPRDAAPTTSNAADDGAGGEAKRRRRRRGRGGAGTSSQGHPQSAGQHAPSNADGTRSVSPQGQQRSEPKPRSEGDGPRHERRAPSGRPSAAPSPGTPVAGTASFGRPPRRRR